MRRSLGAAALALSLAAATRGEEPAPGAPAVSATARPSKTEVTVGEVFAVEVVASGGPGTVWTFPAEAGSETVELRTPTAQPSQAPAGTHRYAAAVFALGDVAVPPVPVRYRLADGTEGEVATAPVPLRVASLLPKDPEGRTLADIRPPLPLTIGGAFWVAVALLAVACAAGLVAWLRRRGRQAPAAPASRAELSPEAEARQALARLEGAGVAAGDPRPFYIALTEVAKRYLERRLGAPVLEMTSSEMTAFLRDDARTTDLAVAMRELAGVADQVKFARGSAGPEEALRHLREVRRLVDVLEERLRPRAEEAGRKAA